MPHPKLESTYLAEWVRASASHHWILLSLLRHFLTVLHPWLFQTEKPWPDHSRRQSCEECGRDITGTLVNELTHQRASGARSVNGWRLLHDLKAGWLALRSLCISGPPALIHLQRSIFSCHLNWTLTDTSCWFSQEFGGWSVSSVRKATQNQLQRLGSDLIWNPSESLQNIPLISVGFGWQPSQTRHMLEYITVISIQESTTDFWGKTSSWRRKWGFGPLGFITSNGAYPSVCFPGKSCSLCWHRDP